MTTSGDPVVRYRALGRSGIEVSTLTLGTMMFGSWGNEDVEACVRMVDRAIDAGITTFDTADIYDAGHSEEILGQAIRGRRDGLVIATKCGNPMSDDPSQRGLSRRWVVQACEDSLRRLGVDCIDLYQMHRPDPETPFEDTLQAFDELITAGKIRAFGTSTFSAAQIEAMQDVAASIGTAGPISEQPPYSILALGIETSGLPACRLYDIGVLVWAPLNGGWLTGKYQGEDADAFSRAARKPEHFDHRDAEMRQTKRSIVTSLTEIATGSGISLKQLALGFVLHDPVVSAAIIGPRTPEQLDDLLAAGHVELEDAVVEAIGALVQPGHNINPYDAG
jgi:aryl-alcohol dehydrogenase-like predicted oxidoreductase